MRNLWIVFGTATACAILSAGVARAQLQEAARYQAESLDALRAADASQLAPGATVWLRSYFEPGDGGAGRFRLDTSGDLGADAANGGTIVAAQGGENWYWRRYHQPGVFRAAWFGAAPGEANARPALKRAFRAAASAAEMPIVRIAPGTYHLAKPLKIERKGLRIEGLGAVFDNTIVFRDKNLWIKGLTVRGVKDGPAFKWHRSQYGTFVRLTAEKCRDGFMLGGSEYDQVALGAWIHPIAVDNQRHGFVLDGSNKKNWVNANTLLQPTSRGNGGAGFITRGLANYNTFIMPQSEGNGAISVRDGGNENTWLGGHYVSANEQGVVFAGGVRSYVFGGRPRGGITGADTVLVRSPIAPKPTRLLEGMHRITVNDLKVTGSASLPGGYASPVPEQAVETRTRVRDYGSGKRHALRIDLNELDNGSSPFLDAIVRGAANFSGRVSQNFHLRLNVSAFKKNGGEDWRVNVRPVQQYKCRVTGSRVTKDGALVVQFETASMTRPTSTDVFVY